MNNRFKITNNVTEDIPYTLWYKMLKILYVRDKKTFEYFKSITELVEQKNLDMLEIDLNFYKLNK